MNEALAVESTQAIRRAELTGAQRDEMFALLTGYFDGVAREQFEEDLAEKDWVIHLRRETRLVGFSTLLSREIAFEGTCITAIYSGDTIVAPEAWGAPELARAWIATVNRLRALAPERRCYWLLLTSGFRTYRFLPVFWRDFFPRAGVATPDVHQRLIDRLAREQYREKYDAMSGLVRFPRPQRLRGRLAEIPAGRVADRDIAFFLEKNPGHMRGDELACMTEIVETNLTGAGRRMVAETRP